MANVKPLLQLLAVEPDRNGLLRWFAGELSPADVEYIAKADAEFDWQDNLRALRRILDNGQLTAPVDVGASWLQEVCSLTMWEALHDVPSIEHRRSICCACACQVLAAAPGEPWHERVFGMSDPVAALASSVEQLGPAAQAACRGMLADACTRFAAANEVGEYEDLFCAAGLLVLMDTPTPAMLQAFLDLEAAAAAEGCGSDSKHWLWRLTQFDQMRPLWRDLFVDLAQRVPSPAADTLAKHVHAWPG